MVSSIKDLGIILSAELSFSENISFISNNAMHILDFIRRICYDFNNIQCLKTSYCSLVRWNLEYESIIWSPSQINNTFKYSTVGFLKIFVLLI